MHFKNIREVICKADVDGKTCEDYLNSVANHSLKVV